MKKFTEFEAEPRNREADDGGSQTELPVIPNKKQPLARPTMGGARMGAGPGGGESPPNSLYSAPTPLPAVDQRNIQISTERLSRLRRSAKKLENSLQDALSQMDTFRKGMKGPQAQSQSRSNQSSLFGTPRPGYVSNVAGLVPDLPPALKKDMKLLPSPMHMWSTKFEINGPKIHDAELEFIKQQEKEKEERKQRAKEKRREALQRSQERLSNNSDAPTFRSLITSLEDVKKNKGKTFKAVGQVTKCLRCNKLFTLNDNHKKACNFHPKGKERIEQYSDRGKLVKVSYVWKCCMAGPDNPGCTYGQHV